MEKEFVTYEQALTLKELGFDEPCFALIAVDEILNSSPSLPMLGDGGYLYEDIELSKNYWEDVKSELEKL